MGRENYMYPWIREVIIVDGFESSYEIKSVNEEIEDIPICSIISLCSKF
jgi:hypothetical protein